jgi:D-alanine transfer protein
MKQAEQEQARSSANNPFGFDNSYWARNWQALIRPPDRPPQSSDAEFSQSVQASPEWTDFDLLLRALRELGAQPLILSLPAHGTYYEYRGVSAEARVSGYYTRLEALGRRYNVQVEDFADHDRDRGFHRDRWSHPSAKGWVYIDQALDAFYHAP